MSKLDKEQEIIKLAAGLKVDWQQNAVKNIVDLCHSKICKFLKNSTGVQTAAQLERLVCENVKLVFEEVWTDEDLVQVIKKYLKLGETIFATLKADLDDSTFATLIERRKIDGRAKDRYVAVIDCRGTKGARRFFTRWHEIAHILTLHGQLELPLHRSRTVKNPTEKLMDTIAGEIGFYDPFFRPILVEETAYKKLDFRTVERIRDRFAPEASYESTLNACVKKSMTPTLLLQIGLGLKKAESEQLESKQNQLFPSETPQPKLRVLKLIGSDSARGTSLQVHRNMEVPKGSIISRLFNGDFETDETTGIEPLGMWRHSDGSSMSYIDVAVNARRHHGIVTALISPVHA
jgi:hypothetical protein